MKFWEWLGRKSPWWFIAAYLLAFVTFTIIYSNLPGVNFIAPNAKFEPYTAEQRHLVEAEIQGDLRDDITRNAAACHFTVPVIMVNFHLGDVDESGFSGFIDYQEGTGDGDMIGIGNTITLTYEPGDAAQFVPTSFDAAAGLSNVRLSTRELLLGCPKIDKGVPFLSVSTHRGLIALANTLGGQIDDPNAKVSRLAYLSAMTITTTGYGDYIPITPAARFYCGLEAILGIMLMGLSINAIAYQANSTRSTS